MSKETIPEEEDLIKSLHSLTRVNNKIVKQNNFWYTFLRGLVSAIGQTLGIAIVLSIVVYILKLLGVFDFIEPYLKTS